MKARLGELIDRFARATGEAVAARLGAVASREDLARMEARLGGLEEKLAALHRLHALAAEDALLAQPRHADPLRLSGQRGQYHSQNTEDGVIAAIFARIGTASRIFVEIGVGDGSENTTRALLETGWEGVWIEADARQAAIIRRNLASPIAAGRLALVEAEATTANVAGLVADALAGRAVDLLSLDVDMNTSHLWRALELAPRACCIEYNASIPAPIDWELPYEPTARWDGSCRFGASLKHLEKLGRAKGMSLVGCDAAGVNAYFVRHELAQGHFPEPFDAETHWEPPRYHLAVRRGHPAPP
jgi:hypothetical protein